MSQYDESIDQGGPWRERAAFHVSIDYATDGDGDLLWRTRAYHEESDTRIVWHGQPAEALLAWMIAAIGQQGLTTRSQLAPSPDYPPATRQPADDFRQIIGISAVAERQLHEAGILTYAQLAASSPADLAALLGIPVERISRRGWITRARALAKLANQRDGVAEVTSQVEQAMPADKEPEPMRSNSAYFEILFDESGEVLERRLWSDGDPAPPALESGHVARFFVEWPLRPGGIVDTGAASSRRSEVELAVDQLELEAATGPQGTNTPRLRAISVIRLDGFGVDQIRASQPRYLAHVLAYDFDSAETKVLRSVTGELRPDGGDQPLDILFAMPEVGRYQILLAVSLADSSTFGAAIGPKLRVTP